MASDDSEQLRQDRASALVRERDATAEDLAYAKGRESMRIDAHLETHDRQLAAINGSVERGARETGRLAERVGQLEQAFTKYVTVAQTRSEVAADLAAKSLSSRQFWVGLVAAVAAVAIAVHV